MIFQQYFHFSELRYFCHFHILCSYLTWSALFERFSYFVQNILLTNKYQEDEKASEKFEAVNDSEEDLKIARLVFTRKAIMVAMDDIVDA